ncbi:MULTISPECIES: M48 family metalloprotease [Acidianus]|uniref:Peptidase M48 domain-containing protein n=1 Tax=Candidatus Acidianus copahuensis TaxID=1160895 RepID=A0A031LSU7_9CREN|nr:MULTISPECIES: M48 family metalloprotease [Acidianus]EZQ10896.1 hypothetical protein CM19_03280 [Candidatus Acidianus copahuensis]NON62011.1 M48 family metalloprotease [Acidianus sp. RZ1]
MNTFILLSLVLIAVDVIYLAIPFILTRKLKVIEIPTNFGNVKVKVMERNEVNAFSFYNGELIITSGMLNLPLEDISAAIAHEIGHIKLLHHLKTLLFINIMLAISLYFFGTPYILIIVSIIMILLQRFLSRLFEIQADSFAGSLVGKENVIDLIMKFGERKAGLLSTHPSALVRVNYLRRG